MPAQEGVAKWPFQLPWEHPEDVAYRTQSPYLQQPQAGISLRNYAKRKLYIPALRPE